MATTPKAKKPATQVAKSKNVIAGKKKRLNFSKEQWGLFVAIAIAVIGVGTYFGVQYYQGVTTGASSCINKTLKQGDRGTCVKYVQTMLNAAIAWSKRPGAANATASSKALSKLSKLTVDGSYGAKTKAAVAAYQTKVKILKKGASTRVSIVANGVVGSSTWGGLCLSYASLSAAKSAGCAGTPYKTVYYY